MEKRKTDRAVFLRGFRRSIRTHIVPELSTSQSRDITDQIDRILVHLILEEEYGDQLDEDFQTRYQEVLETAGRIPNADSSDVLFGLETPIRGGRTISVPFSRLNHVRGIAVTLVPKIYQACAEGNSSAKKVLTELTEIERDFEERINELHSSISNELPSQAARHTCAVEQKVSVTPETITNYLQSRFPSSPGIKVSRLTAIPGGRSKETFFVQIENSRELPREVVMRKDVTDGVIDTTVADEYALIKAIHDYGGVPIPRPFFVEKNPDHLGGSFMVLEKILGENPGEYYVDVKAPTEARYELGADLARLLGRLHSMKPELLASTNISLAVNIEEFLKGLLDECRQRSESTKKEPVVELELAYHWLAEHMEEAIDTPVLIHADMGLHNMLVRDNRIVAVLDWEMARLAAPAMDIGYCRHLIDYLLPWDDFVRIYTENGGPPSACDPKAVSYYAILAYTRITGFCMFCRHVFCSGMSNDLVIANAGYNFLYRAKKLLTSALCETL